ncbi:MAG TPA: hypothetical protein VFG68_17200 [Fimbriiglobus sp.]|nr:hypothetical protein [Fimbriiglobus sp.]
MSVVEWEDAARDELADIWVQATPAERAAIEPIVLGLERDLGDDPLAVGESRNDPLRVEFRDPLTFWFQVSPDDRRVRIVRVHRPRR